MVDLKLLTYFNFFFKWLTHVIILLSVLTFGEDRFGYFLIRFLELFQNIFPVKYFALFGLCPQGQMATNARIGFKKQDLGGLIPS